MAIRRGSPRQIRSDPASERRVPPGLDGPMAAAPHPAPAASRQSQVRHFHACPCLLASRAWMHYLARPEQRDDLFLCQTA